MKRFIATIVAIIILTALFSACAPRETAEDKRRNQQEVVLKQGANVVGMPGIKNFREGKTLKMIQELCDTEVVTFLYLENLIPTVVPGKTALGGKLTYFGESIGYPIPYAAQFTVPETMKTYNIPRSQSGGEPYYGATRLPQADPNGLFKPQSAEATWVLMKDPNGDKVSPIYVEPKLTCSPFKFPFD